MTSDSSLKLKILFLCTGNSCRSQMAEGWVRNLKSDQIEPYSAGNIPQAINANAIKMTLPDSIEI